MNGREVEFDVQAIAEEVERQTAHIRKNLVVAVMGCAVNGPGEAREADVGIAGGGKEILLFADGETLTTTTAVGALTELLARMASLV